MTEHEAGSAEILGGPPSVTPLWRLLDEAGPAAGEVAEPHLRAPLLARIATLHEDLDQELALREAEGAVCVAEAIEDPYVRSFVLAEVAEALAPADLTDVARVVRAALRAAKVVVDVRSKTIALAEVARVVGVGVGDPERAERLLSEAELLADAGCSCRRRCLLAAVLERTADLDPEYALWKAELITDPGTRGTVMARAIPRLAVDDPARAMALVSKVPELHEQIQAWFALAEVLTETHPTLAVIAAEYAEADARLSPNGLVQVEAFAKVARAVHCVDPVYAEKVLEAAETEFERLEHSHSRALMATEVARAQARFDTERGVSTARRITEPHPRAHALLSVAEDVRADSGS